MLEQKFVSFLELEVFTEESLKEYAQLGNDFVSEFLMRSLQMGIAKPVVAARRTDGGRAFQWTFVGVICYEQLSVWVYPKYMNGREPDLEHFQTVMRAIASLESNTLIEEEARELIVEDNLLSNRGAFYLRLVELFEEYGLYGNEESSFEINGGGDIDWPRTFALGPSFVKGGSFYYTETFTRKQVADNTNLVRRIHSALLTASGQFLERSGLGLLLGMDLPPQAGTPLEELGDTTTLLHHIEREAIEQNLLWKRQALDCMRALLSEDYKGAGMESLVVLGTRAFHVLWEEACSVFFGNDLKASLQSLGFPLQMGTEFDPQTSLDSLIPTPTWELQGRDFATSRRLRPDLVRLIPSAGGPNQTWIFAILDAKYYQLAAECGQNGRAIIRGEPELESITKQFLYRTAFRPLIECGSIGKTVNAFLLPSQSPHFDVLGTVRFPVVIESLEPPATNEISVWSLPAENVLRSLFEPVNADSNFRKILDLDSTRGQ